MWYYWIPLAEGTHDWSSHASPGFENVFVGGRLWSLLPPPAQIAQFSDVQTLGNRDAHTQSCSQQIGCSCLMRQCGEMLVKEKWSTESDGDRKPWEEASKRGGFCESGTESGVINPKSHPTLAQILLRSLVLDSGCDCNAKLKRTGPACCVSDSLVAASFSSWQVKAHGFAPTPWESEGSSCSFHFLEFHIHTHTADWVYKELTP